MRKLMYLAVATSGAILLMLGVAVSARGAITYVGRNAIAQRGMKTWATGITLMLGGAGLKVWGLKGLFKILTDEDVDRILQRRLQEIPKPCRGCRNFHGASYGGVMLVCAIHPSGVEFNTCPDYETSKGARKFEETK